jgi:serine/threonine protein kinase
MTPGTRLGVYEITAPLGSGGMGEVFCATDTRLNRTVAIKILPEAVATAPDRVARFTREAKLLASLNHPNIAAIYGFEETPASGSAQPVRALVMELVDGDTLAERLAVGPFAIDDVTAIGRQLAEALEYAHEQGVIHRDLKPANIKITPAGVIKVLDFGLAKALEQGPDGSHATAADASPTMSLAATQAGLILGTAAYMSPEQAKGKPADRRADIWAFGVVLFELLTGRAVYSGETVSETMAHVLTQEPDWARLPPTTPLRLRELLRRCLVKDTKNRLQAIGEARIVLQDLTDAPDSSVEATVGERSQRHREWFWASLAIASLVFAAWMGLRPRSPDASTPEPIRFAIDTPERGGPEYPQGSASLSPDGRKIAYVAVSGSRPLLWVHSFETGTAEPIESSEGIGPAVLIWSPDSRSLAFSVPSERRLKRVAATGGPAHVICAIPEFTSTAAWGAGDVILLSGRGLHRVSATGGEVVPVTIADAARDETPRFPHFLPDGRRYLYLATKASGVGSMAYVGELDSTERKVLPGIASEVKYSSGHVLFLRDGALMAQAFDTRRLEVSGEPFLVVDRLSSPMAVAGAFSASTRGTLAYRAVASRPEIQLTWYDRSGNPVGTAGPPGRYTDVELSPDDRFAVFESAEEGSMGLAQAIGRSGDIWVLDLERGVASRVTTDPARDADPVWSADGKAIAFRGDRDGGHLYQRAFGGVADDVLVFKGTSRESPDHWSPDGRHLVFTTFENDVFALPLGGDRTPIPVAVSKFRETDGRVSQDGRWIAYDSDESGRSEVYVQSFPEPTIKLQVSTTGGDHARWSRDGKELYYASPAGEVMAIGIQRTSGELRVTTPIRLFQAPALLAAGEGKFAVSSTGRFLLMVPVAERATPPITVVLNWRP